MLPQRRIEPQTIQILSPIRTITTHIPEPISTITLSPIPITNYSPVMLPAEYSAPIPITIVNQIPQTFIDPSKTQQTTRVIKKEEIPIKHQSPSKIQIVEEIIEKEITVKPDPILTTIPEQYIKEEEVEHPPYTQIIREVIERPVIIVPPKEKRFIVDTRNKTTTIQPEIQKHIIREKIKKPVLVKPPSYTTIYDKEIVEIYTPKFTLKSSEQEITIPEDRKNQINFSNININNSPSASELNESSALPINNESKRLSPKIKFQQNKIVNLNHFQINKGVSNDKFDNINKEANILQFSEFKATRMPSATSSYFAD